MRLFTIICLFLVLGLFGPESNVPLAAEEAPIQLATAQSVYNEVLRGLNREDSIPIRLSSVPAKSETSSFIEEVRFEIKESVRFPEALKGKGYRSVVIVEFGINSDGTVRDLKAEIKSGKMLSEFEKGAKEAVIRASDFFPLVPDTIKVENLKFKIPIIFEEA